MRGAAALLLAALAASPRAAGEERPNLFPTRDAVIEYRVQGKPNRPPMAIRAHLSASGRIRADPADLAGYLIVDRQAARAMIVMSQQHLVLEFPFDQSPARDLVRIADLTYVRRGEAKVAGEHCTEWDVTAPQGRTAQACITRDGLVLRGEGHDPRYGGGRIEAVSIAYAPQPEALFHAPDNFQRISIPMLPGLAEGSASK